MNLLFILFPIIFGLTSQERILQQESTCGTDCFLKMIKDPSDLVKLPDTIMKETLLTSLQTSLKAMDLPKETLEKITDEKFLKEKIAKAMAKRKEQESEEYKEKECVRVSKKENIPNTSTNTQSTPSKVPKYAPYGGGAVIDDWYDFYHYFPHLATRVRLWKLEFKEASQKHWKRFKGCANPGQLVDWLVPDIEEVKKHPKRKNKKKRARNYDE